jgi:hypothetical protein
MTEPRSDLAQIEPEGGWGEKMKLLPNDRWRLFVSALFDAPRKGGLLWAIKTAGFVSNDASLQVVASRMVRDERVAEAIEEEARRRFRLLPVFAIPALERLIKDPEHKDHGRAVSMLLERFLPVQTGVTVTVQDSRGPSEARIEQVLARIAELAARAGIPLPARPTIEGEVVDVTPPASSAAS